MMNRCCNMILPLVATVILFRSAAARPMTSEEQEPELCLSPTGTLPLPVEYSMPTLGRNVKLGDLYDAVNDRLISSESVCPQTILDKMRIREDLEYPLASETVEKRLNSLTGRMGRLGLALPSNLRQTIAAGLFNLTHQGLWLSEDPPSRNEAVVTILRDFAWRKESLLPLEKNQCIINYHLLPLLTGATHYISSITYGNQQISSIKANVPDTENTAQMTPQSVAGILNTYAQLMVARPPWMTDSDGTSPGKPVLPSELNTVAFNASVYSAAHEKPHHFDDFDSYVDYYLGKQVRSASAHDRAAFEHPVGMTLSMLPSIAESYELYSPSISFNWLDDTQVTRVDMIDAANQAEEMLSANDRDTNDDLATLDYAGLSHRFATTFDNFTSKYLGQTRKTLSALRRVMRQFRSHNATLADAASAAETSDTFEKQTCQIEQLETTRLSSPFSNYITQVWSEVLHREIEGLRPLFSIVSEKQNAQEQCPPGIKDQPPCFVEISFDRKSLDAKRNFLSLQNQWMDKYSADMLADENAEENGENFFHTQGNENTDSISTGRLGRNLVDAAWNAVDAKLANIRESTKLLTRLAGECRDNLQFIVSAEPTNNEDLTSGKLFKQAPQKLSTVEVDSEKLIHVSVTGECSNIAKHYFDYQQ